MNRLRLAIALLAAGASAQTLRPIFDGKTLAGWEQCNGKAAYRVENGAIVGTTVEGSPNSFLCTTREYGDFILEFEVKTDPLLNSGVQIRSHRYERPAQVLTENKGAQPRSHPVGRVYGYQVEVSNEKAGNSAGIYDEARRGWLYNPATENAACAKAFQDNQWNRYRVEARGDSIKTWLNGEACTDLVDAQDLSGFIGLQVHSYKGEKPAEVRWRNIRVAELGRHAWRPIHDGKSLKGWKHEGPGEVSVQDGAIRITHPGGGAGLGFVLSEGEYNDFTMRLLYKAVKGNSGVFFRMGELAGPQRSLGYEIEVDPARDPGGFQEPGKRNWMIRTGPVDPAAANSPPAAEGLRPAATYYRPNDWNEMIVSARGGRIVVHINGYKTADLKDDPGRREGRIALQVNPRQELEVYYKDLALLERARR